MSKVSEEQLFYLMSRGLTEDEAMAMVVRVRRTYRQGVADGVRAGAQPADRIADGRRGRLMGLLTVNKGEQFTSFRRRRLRGSRRSRRDLAVHPLKRLRGLHDGTATPTRPAKIAVSGQPGVTVETVQRDDERLGRRCPS